MVTRRVRFFALVTLLGLLALGVGSAAEVAADHMRPFPAAPVPTLIDVSLPAPTTGLFTATTGLFSVAGHEFTPGGRVYLAIYDQMGAKLYETRWVTAAAAGGYPIGGENGHAQSSSPGGTLRESFANLCGAKAMMRALDSATATWSNWLTVEPTCGVPAYGPH